MILAVRHVQACRFGISTDPITLEEASAALKFGF
jgi:hypothetical protein